MPAKKAGTKKGATKRRAKQLHLPSVLTGPEVQALLGGVSHVTVHKLFKAGKLKRAGLARQQGGGFLYDAVSARKLAKDYKPQHNPPAGKGKFSRVRARKAVTAKAGKRKARRG